MKRSMIIGTVLLAICSTLYAQDWPSEESVLEKARAHYNNQDTVEVPEAGPEVKRETTTVENPDGTVITTTTTITTVVPPKDKTEEVPSESRTEAKPYTSTPYVIGFVPGIQFPFGETYSTSLGMGCIGISLGEVNGIVGAGVFSLVAGTMNGVQAAGVFNTASGDVNGVQWAGVFNVANGDVVGPLQWAGVFNIARGKLNGFQAAGVFNIAEDVDGAQVAGVFNVAKNVKGAQIGIVNIADSVDGIQLGLVSISKDGIGNIQSYWETGDVIYGGIQFGTKRFYTLVLVKETFNDWFDNFDSFGTSLGFGWRAATMGSAYIDLDINAKQSWSSFAVEMVELVVHGKTVSVPVNKNYEIPHPYLRASFGLPLFSGVEVFGGASCDLEFPQGYSISDTDKIGAQASFRVWGLDVNAFGKVFFGVKIEG